jgi:hypothetical protein
MRCVALLTPGQARVAMLGMYTELTDKCMRLGESGAPSDTLSAALGALHALLDARDALQIGLAPEATQALSEATSRLGLDNAATQAAHEKFNEWRKIAPEVVAFVKDASAPADPSTDVAKSVASSKVNELSRHAQWTHQPELNRQALRCVATTIKILLLGAPWVHQNAKGEPEPQEALEARGGMSHGCLRALPTV